MPSVIEALVRSLSVAWYAQNDVITHPHARTASLGHPHPHVIVRRRRETFKNYCKRRAKNKPKKTRARSRCRYCNDVLAGIHWKLRNKKGCARLDTCIAKKYAPRKPGESQRLPLDARLLPAPAPLCVN